MLSDLSYRKAALADVSKIIALLMEDALGQQRESLAHPLAQSYVDAFYQIDRDPNHYLMVVEKGAEIVATCHLTLMPSLTFRGSTRLEIEAVRVAEKYRGQKIGEWMITAAIAYGKSQGAKIIQLTTSKMRARAKKFYENLGFTVSHEGLKHYL